MEKVKKAAYPFSSVRLRTNAAKHFKKVENASATIWKLLMVAEKSFRALKGYWLLQDVYAGNRFVDGKKVVNGRQTPERIAA